MKINPKMKKKNEESGEQSWHEIWDLQRTLSWRTPKMTQERPMQTENLKNIMIYAANIM